ncbi:hypothetical protein DC081_09885 [Ignatzschineria cameli]|uniref:Uncharacterized protein n=2 Tax=Ignatzschineria cameli TaxID=2182793 RepID=A0A2U2AKG4_9GAMM|nr:hypothetical protein DC077_09810 [Ignatzschineria cameli]PWD88421.1 hypothetical protein DC079_09525 [Ignatzschineria cameli]PWD88969.1 hypothetical protein DC081_09885 [Ignatzschineria cameli]PWD89661.1 hypothetical protein DC078_09660 [Ignatzschineria cameli]
MRPLFLLSTLILSSSIAFAQVDAAKVETPPVVEKGQIEATAEKLKEPTEPRQIRAQARIHKEECATGDCPGKAQNENRGRDKAKAQESEMRKEMKQREGKQEAKKENQERKDKKDKKDKRDKKEKKDRSERSKKHHNDKGHSKKEKQERKHHDGSMKGNKGAKQMEGRN